MADERKRVGMKSKGEKTGGAKGLPAALFAEGGRGGAATVMKDEGLVVVF